MGSYGCAVAGAVSRVSTHTGRTVLVTGASSGLGKACAERLIRDGANVIAVGRDRERLLAVEGISLDNVIVADLLQPDDIKRIVDGLKSSQRSLNGCVLAAGVHSFRPIMLENFAEIAKPMASNVLSPLALVAALVKSRALAKGASVVLFSSTAARTGSPIAVSYAASKGAIESATFSLALELAPQGIRVNAVAPGVIRTPMSEGFLSKLTAEQVARLDARHVLGAGSPSDVSGPVAFLLSDDARWVTGAVLPIDGGYSIS